MFVNQLSASRPGRVATRRGRSNTLVVRALNFGKKTATTTKGKKEPAKKAGGGLFGSVGSKAKPEPAKKSAAGGGLFGSKGSKPKKASAPAKKKAGGAFSIGSKPKAPAKKKAGGTFSIGSKPKAPAKKKAGGTFSIGSKPKPAPKKAAKKTQRVGTKKTNGSSTPAGAVDLPFFGELNAGEMFKTGDDRYYSNVQKGSKAKGAQRIVGYKGSSEKGSAPLVDAQGVKAKYGGVVYRFGDKYGGNIDEFSPIFTPDTRSPTGDTYEPGLLGIAVWFAGFASLLAVGGFSIYSTSALAG